MLEQLLKEQDLLGDELEGLDGLGETFPVIQWCNDRKALTGQKVQRGGFVMTDENADAAGDFPAGAQPNTIEFAPNNDNPNGSESGCFYTPELTFIPLGMRKGWFADGQRLRNDFNWDDEVEAGNKPSSKTQIHAVVKGERGLFIARITFRSTVAKDAGVALSEHNRNVQTALRKAGINNRAVKTNGWRWFWLTLEAGAPTMRGKGDATSAVTPVQYKETGEYIGDLRNEYFDAEEIRRFEQSWKTVEVANEPEAPQAPPEPDYDEIPF